MPTTRRSRRRRSPGYGFGAAFAMSILSITTPRTSRSDISDIAKRFPTAREAGIMRSMQIGETRRVRGIAVPSIMYGTAWKEERTQALTSDAIACGFRAIDTANQRKHYVEAGVGAAVGGAVASGSVTREQLFLQTKFTWPRGQDHRLPFDPDADLATQVQQSIDSSFKHLGVTRIDSYILHSPSRGYGLAEVDWEIWRAMEEAMRAGRVGLLGA